MLSFTCNHLAKPCKNLQRKPIIDGGTNDWKGKITYPRSQSENRETRAHTLILKTSPLWSFAPSGGQSCWQRLGLHPRALPFLETSSSRALASLTLTGWILLSTTREAGIPGH